MQPSAMIKLRHFSNRLNPARGAWLLFAALNIWMLLVGLPGYIELSKVVCPVDVECLAPRISPDVTQILQEKGLSLAAYSVYQVLVGAFAVTAYWIAGLLVYWSKSRNRFALPIAFLLFGMGTSFLLSEEVLSPAWLWFYHGSGIVLLTFFFLFFYLFPDGRFLPRWTVFLMPIAFFFNLANGFWSQISEKYLWPLPILLIAGGLTSQVYRYRRVSSPEQRQQTKWVVFGAGLAFLVLILLIAPYSLLSEPTLTRYGLIANPLIAVGFALIPVSITIAILRYRLWDIDLLIRRTLVYAVLTTMLALVYFGLVILLEGALRSLVGGGGQVATVISTITIAALFTPLRRRVQEAIDRRFYRRKYNAEQALAQFAAAARSETDLETLSAQVVEIVQKTMQPEQVSLWLREDSISRAERSGKSVVQEI